MYPLPSLLWCSRRLFLLLMKMNARRPLPNIYLVCPYSPLPTLACTPTETRSGSSPTSHCFQSHKPGRSDPTLSAVYYNRFALPCHFRVHNRRVRNRSVFARIHAGLTYLAWLLEAVRLSLYPNTRLSNIVLIVELLTIFLSFVALFFVR